MRVGFIGLGSQGAPMARRIVEAGYETTLWARRPASLEPFGDTAASSAATPAELADRSDLVCLCVVNDDDVREILTGSGGLLSGLKPGATVAVHSTVHPDTCRALAEQAAAVGVRLLDAPVSGGGPAAAEGTLLVMVGGPAEVVEECRTVFETYGDPVVHLGDVGSGQTAKLLNNLLFTANLGTSAATLALGSALGVDPARLGQVIGHGTAASFALDQLVRTGGTLDILGQVAGELLRKDVGLVAALAAAASAQAGQVLAAADETLTLMGRPR